MSREAEPGPAGGPSSPGGGPPLGLAARAGLAALFAGCLAVSLVAMRVGWTHTLLDLHGFRQTQTAIAADAILQGGPWVRYHTPVLGPPWSIPYEFPLFQWLVVAVVRGLGLDLDQAGRLVSASAFYLSLIPAFTLLGRLGIARAHRLAFLALWLASPIYLFWSRTFMIESLGLALGLGWLALLARWLDSGRPVDEGLGSVCGALAALVKVTTFAGCLLGGALLVLRHVRRPAPGSATPGRGAWRAAVGALLTFGVPIAVGTAWVALSDATKSMNPLAAGFITSEALAAWHYGSWSQKLDPGVWRLLVLWRAGIEIVGHPAMLAVGVLAPLLARRRRALALAFGALFLAGPATFTNLHVIHNYYAYANGVFLLGAVGAGIVGLVEAGHWRRRLGFTILALALLAELGSYSRTYLTVQRQDHRQMEPLVQTVRALTGPEDTLLVYGLDWSSELPYYARRRAVMDRDDRPLDRPPMSVTLENLAREGRTLGALVVCGASRGRPGLARTAVERLDFAPEVVFADPRCDLYRRARVSGGERLDAPRPAVRGRQSAEPPPAGRGDITKSR